MKLTEIVEELGLDVKCCREGLDVDVRGGYASDLLSDVMANSGEGDVWITLQIHKNIVAIAGMKGLAGIIVINGRQPDEDTLGKAEEEGIPVVVSDMPAFELIGRLYALGIRGAADHAEGV